MRQSPLLLAILGVLGGCADSFEGEACFTVPADQASCPDVSEVDRSKLFVKGKCGDFEIDELRGPGKLDQGATDTGSLACCYQATITDHSQGECVIGRPYYEGDESVVADVCGDDATEPERARLWARAGAAEHASVAAFSRLALQLMALGAPNELLRSVHQAALDEIGHADLCWDMVERLGGSRVASAVLPLQQPIALESLAAVAAATVREGCLAETLGAHVAMMAAELAPEADVQSLLRRIAREESQHAVLSYRIVAWALRIGGMPIKRAVASALRSPWPRLDVAELALRANVAESQLLAAAEQGVAEVLEPAVARLLAA
jgi:hypothetical protein